MSHPTDPREPGAAAAIEPSVVAFDVDVLHDLVGSLGDPAAVAALYRKFVLNAAQFIGELSHQDRGERIETLHTLKGSAAMLGAKRLALLAAGLQSEFPSSSVQVATAIEGLAGELAQFRAAAEDRLSALGAPLGNAKGEPDGEL